MLHGNRGDPRKEVHVYCRCDPGNGVSIVVRDEGNGFNPDQFPHPTLSQVLYSNARRGIFIMKFCMDEVTFENGGTEVHLLKRTPCMPRPALRNSSYVVGDFSRSTEHGPVVGSKTNPRELEER